jgi:glycosyltransferase involved in cell wall biosynthesis
VRVLVANHTGLISGAEVVTLHLMESLPSHVQAVLACPEGPLAERARATGIAVAPVAGMTGSLRLHPIETPRAVKDLVALGWAIRAVARQTAAEVVYAASIRAGLATGLSAGLGRPLVVGLHDCLPPGLPSAVTKRIVDRRAAAIVANSRHTAHAWRDERRGPPIAVLHPPIDLTRYQPQRSRLQERARLALDGDAAIVGVAAQITPWKGQDTAVRALARIREQRPDAQLVLAGGTTFVDRATRYDNQAYLASLERLIAQLGLEGSVRFLGPRDDLPSVLASLDVLLVPSWEEPFGLVVVEAMAAGTPVVATSVGGPQEVIADGINGRLVPPDRPELWAATVTELLADARLRDRIAREGLATARGFRRDAYAERLAEVCASAASRRSPGLVPARSAPL